MRKIKMKKKIIKNIRDIIGSLICLFILVKSLIFTYNLIIDWIYSSYLIKLFISIGIVAMLLVLLSVFIIAFALLSNLVKRNVNLKKRGGKDNERRIK